MSMTIKELYVIAKNRGLFNQVGIDEYLFMNTYVENHSVIDRNLIQLYGNRMFDSLEDTLHDFDLVFSGYFLPKVSNFQKMYDALNINYNPIENYDKYSEIITNYQGKEKNNIIDETIKSNSGTNTFSKNGSINRTDNNILSSTNNETNVNIKSGSISESSSGLNENTKSGSIKDTNVNGEKNFSENFGERKETHIPIDNSSTNSISAFNSDSLVNVSKIENKQGTSHVTDTIQAFTNTKKENSFTDTKTQSFENYKENETNSSNNTQTFNNVTDNITSNGTKSETNNNTFTESYNEYSENSTNSNTENVNNTNSNIKEFEDRQDIVNERTHGNIGVTKATEMIENEVNLRLSMDFYKLIFSQFILEYTY